MSTGSKKKRRIDRVTSVELPPGVLVKTVNAFPHPGLLWLGVRDINAPTANDRARNPGANRRAPQNSQSFDRKSFENAGLVPNAVAGWPTELWPVLP